MWCEVDGVVTAGDVARLLSRRMGIRYTTLAVRDLPFPHGLGKFEYKALETGMRRLLGEEYGDPEANAREFWTSSYQGLIRHHLAPHFDCVGDIVAIARGAAESARKSLVFDIEIPVEDSYSGYVEYKNGIPAWTDSHPSVYARETLRWTHHPPRLSCTDGTTLEIDDGRHRLALLRSRLEQLDPDYRVLVAISTPRH